jgi:hypothetical protein
VTSIRRILANRSNARKSTGPKTPAGKARSSRNALRHGFRGSAFGAGAFTEDVEALARVIMERSVMARRVISGSVISGSVMSDSASAGGDAGAEIFARACRIASAQLDLGLIRQAKRDLQAAAHFGFAAHDHTITDGKSPDGNSPEGRSAGDASGDDASADDGAPDATSHDWTLLLPISRLDRYEQRALTRRQRAMRDFNACPGEETAGNSLCQTKPTGKSAMNSVNSSQAVGKAPGFSARPTQGIKRRRFRAVRPVQSEPRDKSRNEPRASPRKNPKPNVPITGFAERSQRIKPQ